MKDVQLVLEAWGLGMPSRNETLTIRVGRADFTESPYQLIAQLSREQGLKAIIERLRYATKFAADEDADLTWEHLVRAHVVVASNAQKPESGWIH